MSFAEYKKCKEQNEREREKDSSRRRLRLLRRRKRNNDDDARVFFFQNGVSAVTDGNGNIFSLQPRSNSVITFALKNVDGKS